jgi:hypothetical protein
MTSTKNIHVPDDLLTAMEAAARAQGKTVDQLAEKTLRDALEFESLLAQGHSHARSRGFKPSEVSKKISEFRRETPGRSR